jgi:beta-glucosidase
MKRLYFKCGATGHFELLVNGESLTKYDNWRTLPFKNPFKVESGKKYKIEIRYAQLNDWQANIEFNFGKEVDVDYTELLKKLQGTDVVILLAVFQHNSKEKKCRYHTPGSKAATALI